jgi:hypothetical protein
VSSYSFVPPPAKCARPGCGHPHSDHKPLCKEDCLCHRFMISEGVPSATVERSPDAERPGRSISTPLPPAAASMETRPPKMGFFSMFGRKAGGSSHFEAALRTAQRLPCDTDCCRLVIASPTTTFTFDVTLAFVEATLREFQHAGAEVARAAAAQVMGRTLSRIQEHQPALLRHAALAYFDFPFLNAKPWNTLGLDVSVDGTQVNVARGIFHLRYPKRA